MSLFEELKRRNVFRVGIAYAVTVWVLIQALSIFLPTFEAPGWVMKVISLVLIAGFPVVLIFAWAYELTPEGIKREQEVDRSQSIAPKTGKKLNHAIIGLMAVAIAFLLYERFSAPERIELQSNAQTAGTETGEAVTEEFTPAPASPRQSIAVLPFDNRSRNEDDEFFVEGVHDDLLTNLARIGSLKVISRTSVLRFKDTELPIPEIARELGVATVMEGAVQRSGGIIRINVQLIDAQTDEHLWAEIFDREMTAENLFAIQSEISQKIAEALKSTLTPEEQKRISDLPTENLAAYNAYLRGRQLQERRNSTDLQKALAEFERAVELDPEFALAWVGVADTNLLLVGYSTLPLLTSLERRESAVDKALKINDQLGEAHLSRAMVLSAHEQYDEADAAFRRSLELSPNYARAYQWYSDFMTRWPARWMESMELTRKAVELDPLSPILQLEVTEKLSLLGRYAAAESQVERLMQSDPEFTPSVNMMADIKANLGKFDEQVQWQRRALAADPGRLFSYNDLAFAYLNMGDPEALEAIRESIRAKDPNHASMGFVDLVEAVYRQNYPASLEAGRWYGNQIGNPPSWGSFFGFVHMLAGDYEQALEAFLHAEPRFGDNARWADAIQQETNQGCQIGWLMIRTGDANTGMALIDRTLEYLEAELPQYTEHADRFAPDACYLARDENEKALTAFETRVAHGHIGGWWLATQLPWNEPLRGTPRFEAALKQIRDLTEQQRARLENDKTVAGP